MRIEKVETHEHKIRLQRRDALAVALSPHGEYAAFVFDKEIRLCELSQSHNGSLNVEVVMTLEKGKKGKFIAAALSNSHLVAIAQKEVRLHRHEERFKSDKVA
jgi:hypothetical protein